MAGPDAHIAIIKLLRYVAAKYLLDFSLTDEGYYWETDSVTILLNQFKKYKEAIDSFCEAIERLPAVTGETPVSLSDRMERLLNRKYGIS